MQPAIGVRGARAVAQDLADGPCLYLVDGLGHGFVGGSSGPPGRSLALALAARLVTSTVAVALFAGGYKIRT